MPQKLSLSYFGPYQSAEKIGKVAYRLMLSSEAKVHNVFHVSKLKKYEDISKPIFVLVFSHV